MARAKATPEKSIGEQIIAGLEEVVADAGAGGLDEIKRQLTVRQVKRGAFPRESLSGPDVVAIRDKVGASQVVFANLIGVSANTVRAWEQGANVPSGMAAKFLAEIGGNAAYWRAKVVAATEMEITVKPGTKAKAKAKTRAATKKVK